MRVFSRVADLKRTSRGRYFWILFAAITVSVLLTHTGSYAQSAPGANPSSFLDELGSESQAWKQNYSLLKNMTISGYVSENVGVFIDSKAIEYNPSKNSISSLRTTLQIDVNNQLGENDQIFMRNWFVYEPSYPFEDKCPQFKGGVGPCNSDFYNQYGVREVWIKDTRGPLETYVGRQIVTWGESLSFRVGDQINPQDTSWAFGFANLEQSRTPLWMIHPILNLPDLGPTSSNFFETIYIPGTDFLYTQVANSSHSLEDQYSVAGRVNISAPSGSRFAPRPDNRCDPTFEVSCASGVASSEPPTSVLVKHGFTPDVETVIPAATWANSQVGARLHTLIFNSEIAAYYLYSHEYSPVLEVGPITRLPEGKTPGIRRVTATYPNFQSFAVTGNRPLYLPGKLASWPFVLRGEMFYKNHKAFNWLYPAYHWAQGALNPSEGGSSFITHSDQVLWLLALDLDNAPAPWLSETGSVTANLEINGTTTLSPNQYMQASASNLTRLYHNDINVLTSIGDSWYWAAIAPTWTSTFNPNGLTFTMFPSVVLTPPWTDKYFVKFTYIGIVGNNRYGTDNGYFKGKSQFVGNFQYNFSLL
jgi:hypothetical protein